MGIFREILELLEKLEKGEICQLRRETLPASKKDLGNFLEGKRNRDGKVDKK